MMNKRNNMKAMIVRAILVCGILAFFAIGKVAYTAGYYRTLDSSEMDYLEDCAYSYIFEGQKNFGSSVSVEELDEDSVFVKFTDPRFTEGVQAARSGESKMNFIAFRKEYADKMAANLAGIATATLFTMIFLGGIGLGLWWNSEEKEVEEKHSESYELC